MDLSLLELSSRVAVVPCSLSGVVKGTVAPTGELVSIFLPVGENLDVSSMLWVNSFSLVDCNPLIVLNWVVVLEVVTLPDSWSSQISPWSGSEVVDDGKLLPEEDAAVVVDSSSLKITPSLVVDLTVLVRGETLVVESKGFVDVVFIVGGNIVTWSVDLLSVIGMTDGLLVVSESFDTPPPDSPRLIDMIPVGGLVVVVLTVVVGGETLVVEPKGVVDVSEVVGENTVTWSVDLLSVIGMTDGLLVVSGSFEIPPPDSPRLIDVIPVGGLEVLTVIVVGTVFVLLVRNESFPSLERIVVGLAGLKVVTGGIS